MDDENLGPKQDEYIRTLELSVRLLQRELDNFRSRASADLSGSKDFSSEEAPAVEFYKAASEQEIIEALFDKLKTKFDLIECNIFIFNPDKRLYGIENASTDISLSKKALYLEEKGITDWASELDHPIKAAIPEMEGEKESFALISPLRLRGKIIGLFIGLTPKAEQPDKASLDYMSSMAEYAAIATDNIRSSREISQVNSRLANLNRRMLQSSQLASLGEIAASVAKELEHPVKIIEGNVKLIENGIGNLTRRFAIIYDQINSIREFTAKLNKLTFEEGEIQMADVDLKRLLEEVLLISNWQLTRDGIKVEKDFDEAECIVLGNKLQLEQVFLSLLLNSRDAMPEGGVINLGIFCGDKNKITVSVADTGMGIEEQDIKKLFDPYYYMGNEKKTGLGLYMSGKIIEQHRGKILVNSDMGKGTTVKVILPAIK